MSEVKWSGLDVLKFLNIYRGYPSLWDSNSSDYLNRIAKRASFDELLAKLDEVGLFIAEDQLRRKIKSIRDTYRNELNKVIKSNNVYRPKLIWYENADTFLNAVVSGRRYSSNLDLVYIGEDDCLPLETEFEDVLDETDTSMERVSTSKKSLPKRKPSPLQPLTTNKQKRCGSSSLQLSLRTKYPSRHEAALDKSHNTVDVASIEPAAATSVEDQYVSFAKHIVSQLRELPLRSFIQLQNQIQQLITEERLSQLDNEQSTNLDNVVCSNCNTKP